MTYFRKRDFDDVTKVTSYLILLKFNYVIINLQDYKSAKSRNSNQGEIFNQNYLILVQIKFFHDRICKNLDSCEDTV